MATCVHGFDADQCMICETLGTLPRSMGGQGAATTTKEADREDHNRRFWPGRGRQGGTSLSRLDLATPPSQRRHHPMATAALVIVALVAILAAIWVVVGVVFAILRLIEVVAVAIAAGWIGYRVGHWRGRHDQ